MTIQPSVKTVALGTRLRKPVLCRKYRNPFYCWGVSHYRIKRCTEGMNHDKTVVIRRCLGLCCGR